MTAGDPQAVLDDTFAALAHPVRRGIVNRLLGADGIAVSDLAAPYAMSLPAVMKHLDVLDRAGIVLREKRGRTVRCKLNPEPMRRAFDWLERYERFWSERLDSLAKYLEKEPWTPKP